MNKHLLGFYNYTVILTYSGMLIAFLGIIFLINNIQKPAILCLMISGLCDMFDGSIAATKQRNHMEKQFGIQIDSLSDLIAFGILPALFVYFIFPGSLLNMLASCTYTLCALIRLAYFNVVEEKRQNSRTYH